MPIPVVSVGVAGTWRTALIAPFADDAGAFQHDELVPDNASPGFNSALRGSECENRRVDIRWRCLPFRAPVSATKNVDSEDREDATNLLEKHLSIGLLGL